MKFVSKIHPLVLSSVIFGVLSVFLWEVATLPILALACGVLGFAYAENKSSKWVAVAGAALGLVFLLVELHSKLNLGF